MKHFPETCPLNDNYSLLMANSDTVDSATNNEDEV